MPTHGGRVAEVDLSDGVAARVLARKIVIALSAARGACYLRDGPALLLPAGQSGRDRL